MSKQIEALKRALEGLEKWHFDKDPRGAADYIAAIHDALAEDSSGTEQPSNQLDDINVVDIALDRMAENARELGLDYKPIVEQVEDSVGMGHKAWDMVDPKELAKEFHKAFAEQPPCKTGSQCTSKCEQCRYKYDCDKAEQPAQKIVEEYDPDKRTISVYPSEWKAQQEPVAICEYCEKERPVIQAASTPWVGLTEDEVNEIVGAFDYRYDVARAIEAKLREKNA